jgi:predicted MFS family arabinose efflux permease
VSVTRTAAAAAPLLLTVMLALAYTMNFLDRQIIVILGQLIKEDLRLSDQELGLLGGLAFAIFYALLGIPVARLAERWNRVTIISTAVALWSVMTCVCGFASSFGQLFLARIGVGIGEAGCTPAAHSLLADSFPPHKRSTALAIYSLGIPLGTLLGIAGGGWLGQTYGWRHAFLVVGLPGVLLALLIRVTLREPERGRFDPVTSDAAPTFGHVLTTLFTKPAYWHLLAGLALCTFAGAGVGTFIPPFLLRGAIAPNLTQIALVTGLSYGILALAGTAAGGLVTDWAGKHNPRAYLFIPGVCFVIATPLLIWAYFQTRFAAFAVISSLAHFMALVYLGPSFAVLHNMVQPRMRASAVAITFLVISVLGVGLGPFIVGTLSDFFARGAYPNPPTWSHLCSHGATTGACQTASFIGVRWALICATLFYLWAGIHYLLGARHLQPRPAARSTE